MVKSLFMNYPHDSGCPYHRLLLPARFCGPDFGEKYGWEFHVGEGLPPGHDIYMLSGLISEQGVIQIARRKRQGAKFIWGLDDDWLSIPDWNPAKPTEDQLAMYDLLKEMCDWVVVSTPKIASTLSDIKDKVLVAPNLLDLERFPKPQFTEEGGQRQYSFEFQLPVRVVWSGGITHREDVALLTPVIERLMETYDPTKVVVIFQGMQPPPVLIRKYLHRGLFHQPSVPFAAYQQILNSITPHVYLAPLAPVEFNKSKSNLRVMEAWALLCCPVASDWGEYSCINSGVDGRLAASTEEWWSALNRVVRDHEYRLRMSANGRGRVEAQYDWNNVLCRREWYTAFSKILGVESPVQYEETTASDEVRPPPTDVGHGVRETAGSP